MAVSHHDATLNNKRIEHHHGGRNPTERCRLRHYC
jgi:hypothetical protein